MSWIVPRSRCVYLPLRLSVCLCFFVFSPAPLVSRLSYCVRLFRVSPRWLLLLLLSRFLYYSLVPFFRRDEFACTCVSIITTPLAFKHVRTRFPGRVTRSSFRMLSVVVLVFSSYSSSPSSFAAVRPKLVSWRILEKVTGLFTSTT